MNSHIGIEDDCISIGLENSNLWIEDIAYGPSHGISIGSLGWEPQEHGVQNMTVKTVTFTGTENGVRVKIKLGQDRAMALLEGSGVKISDIMYENIHGTLATEVAVN
ncbi:Polygalacturonase [Capsicum chinense]|nr:Polygalacturonase [Capsicum chinense]